MPHDTQQAEDAGQAAFPDRAQRNKTDWIGPIRAPDGAEIPCTMKDVSKTGAKIAAPASYTLPDSFMLKVVGKDYVCRVKLAWRRGQGEGGRLTATCPISVTRRGLVFQIRTARRGRFILASPAMPPSARPRGPMEAT
jgi:hypothetical protein